MENGRSDKLPISKSPLRQSFKNSNPTRAPSSPDNPVTDVPSSNSTQTYDQLKNADTESPVPASIYSTTVVDTDIENSAAAYTRYSVPDNHSTSAPFHLTTPLVTSGLPFMGHSNYSTPVNLMNPVADPNLLAGYPSAALVPTPHLATYTNPVGPLVIRPTGLPYMATQSPTTADMQSLAHSAPGTAQPVSFLGPPVADTNTSSDDRSSQDANPGSLRFTTAAPVSDAAVTNSNSVDRNSGDYYVMVHVDVGATFSVRVGDKIQHIPGPATVRMVSNSGPPIPMPMQVPAGHLVQQIVDEEGILKHVILSLYPGPAAAATNTPPQGTSAQPAGINGSGAANVMMVDPRELYHHPSPSQVHPVTHSPIRDTSNRGPRGAAAVSGPFSQYAHSHHLSAPLGGPHLHSPFLPAHPHVPVAQLQPTAEAGASHFHSPSHLGPQHSFVRRPSSAATHSSPALGGPSSDGKFENGLPVHEDTTHNVATFESSAVECGRRSSETEQHASVPGSRKDLSPTSTLARREKTGNKPTSLSRAMHNSDSHEAAPSVDSSGKFSAGPASYAAVTAAATESSQHTSKASEQFRRADTSESLTTDSPDTPPPPQHSGSGPPPTLVVPSGGATQSVPGNSSRRRGRAGTGRSHGTFRTAERSTTSSSTSKASVTNGSLTSSPFPPNHLRESDGPTTTRSSTGDWLTETAGHLSNGSRHARSQLSSWPSHYAGTKAARRSQQGDYVLSATMESPSPMLCGPVDPSSVDVYDMMLVNNGGNMLTQTTDTPDTASWDQQAIRAVLSALRPPQVSDIKTHSALIHLTLPDDLTVRLYPPEDAGPSDSFVDQLQTGGDRTTTATHSKTGQTSSKRSKATSSGQSLEAYVLDESAIQFELYLAERDSSARFNCVFVGEGTNISLQDLRPGSDYHVKYCCVYGDIQGHFSSAVRFSTASAEPSAPRSVSVIGHTRNSLQLKWSAATDNGSRITSYCVEYAPAAPASAVMEKVPQSSWTLQSDQAPSAESDFVPTFVEGFRGLARTCKIQQLTPSTTYLFRVMAQNSHGNSPWSSVVAGSTSGSPPPTPPTPYLVSASVHTLTLAWHPLSHTTTATTNQPNRANHGERPYDVSYTLEMDDEVMGHGFVTVFDGTGTEHCVENLRRNTRYQFRLAASNVDGRSRWTDPVAFSTLPDRPSAPQRLRLTKPVQSTRVTFTWDPPVDDGGLPIRAYQLELRLPHDLLSSHRHLHASTVRTTADDSFAWACPNVVGIPGKTLFACGHDDRTTTTTAANSNHNLSTTGYHTETQPILPKPVLHSSASTSDLSSASDCAVLCCCHHCDSADPLCTDFPHRAAADCVGGGGGRIHPDTHGSPAGHQFRWFVVYEGSGRTVTVANLLPGLQLWSRVRALTASTDSHDSIGCAAGVASNPPLKVIIPPTVPSCPASGPRLVGQPKSNVLHLAWLPPLNTGGSPILTYELMQMKAHSRSSPDESPDAEQRRHKSPVPSSRSASPERFSTPTNTGGAAFDLLSTQRSRSLDSCHTRRMPCAMCGTVARAPSATYIIHTVTDLELVVTNLLPGRTYAFRVRAANVIGRGPWSPVTTWSTMACPPEAPVNPPRPLPVSPTQVRIMWDAVMQTNGAAVKEYWVEWLDCSDLSAPEQLVDSPDFQLLYVGPDLSCELDGARPASRLAFRVCATNTAGPGQWSPIGACVMPSTTPSQPADLKVIDREAAATTVQWTAPDSNGFPVTSYQLELRPSDSPREQLIEIPASVGHNLATPSQSDRSSVKSAAPFLLRTVQHVFTTLQPSATYHVRVRALNFLGYGPFSAPVALTVLPLPPSAPIFGTPTQLTASSVRLQWHTAAARDAPGGPPGSTSSDCLRFRVQSSVDPDCDWTTIFEGPETVFKATRLNENTTYYFRVQALNVAGPGAWGNCLDITTPRLPPPMVRGVKITDVTMDSCQIDWSAVPPLGSDPIVYTVQILPLVELQTPVSTTSQAQMYRCSVTSCRVTHLLPNVDYVCRVCAVRLCQPSAEPVGLTSAESSTYPDNDRTLGNGDKVEHLTSGSGPCVRRLLDPTLYHVTELPGTFSHGVQFGTRSSSKLSPKHQSCLSQSTTESDSPRLFSSVRTLWCTLLSPFHLRHRRHGNKSLGETGSSASPLWRRRFLTDSTTSAAASAGMMVPQSSSGGGAVATPQQASPTHHTRQSTMQSSTTHTKRQQQHWFRLSDRKWAFLFLILFVLATLLVSWSLQCFLAVPPSVLGPTIKPIHSDLEQQQQQL